jgi:hypothetical protein
MSTIPLILIVPYEKAQHRSEVFLTLICTWKVHVIYFSFPVNFFDLFMLNNIHEDYLLHRLNTLFFVSLSYILKHTT